MLTRLKVSGFKNLVDVDIRFGPFTCIAGANGVGKSNLFDAIQFLSALAGNTLIEAALSVRRSEGGRTADVRALFHRIGSTYDQKMSFEVEMIVPKEGVDDLGQKAEAKITFLRYRLELVYRVDESLPSLGSLELVREDLEHINIGEAGKHLKFPHKVSTWRKSAVMGRSTTDFISTETDNNKRTIKLHQDGSSGRPKAFLASTLPRTVLSTVNATESPTALLARREMLSWRLLQLEPSALREPDEFTASPGLRSDGSNLPATLYHLARSYEKTNDSSNGVSATWIYEQVAGRLSGLIDDIRTINVDRDEKRQLLTLEVTDRDKTVHPARSLSDGTLRFLALAVLELDPQTSGLICLEEPENGIHPKRIPAMLQLLEAIATDVNESVSSDNPLRQVIVNTHSPVVVNQVYDNCLLVAELKELIKDKQRFKGVQFSWLADTWRTEAEFGAHPVAKGKVLDYLRQVIEVGNLSTYPYPLLEHKKSQPKPINERMDLFPQVFAGDH